MSLASSIRTVNHRDIVSPLFLLILCLSFVESSKLILIDSFSVSLFIPHTHSLIPFLFVDLSVTHDQGTRIILVDGHGVVQWTDTKESPNS